MFIASALGLYILVSIFSSGTESESRWKILLIAIASGIVLALVSNALPGLLGFFLAILLSLGLIAATLVFWCRVERAAALKIAASYFGLCVGLVILFGVVGAYIHKA